jgi:DNA-binding MarR family transcriptional regulator
MPAFSCFRRITALDRSAGSTRIPSSITSLTCDFEMTLVLTIFVITINIMGFAMKGTSQSAPRRKLAPCPEEAAFLDLLRTTDLLSRGPASVLKSEDLSATQYNVLRILRGAPQGLPCGEIGNRMITRDPDITRLLDRLEKRSLIVRARDRRDRRTVIARISSEGLRLLARLDEPVQDAHRNQLGHLGRQRLDALTDLLRISRSRVE